MIANEVILPLDELAIIVHLGEGSKTKVPVLNVIKHPWIEVCRFRSDVEHPCSLG